MNTKQKAEGFFTFLVLLTVFALVFGAVNKFPSRSDDIINSGGNSNIGDSGGTGDNGNPGSSGDSGNDNTGNEEPSDEPQEPEVPECEHVDADDDNLCDSCGEEFSDGEDITEPEEPDNPPDEPQEPEVPACEHVDAEDNNLCDKCGAEFSDGDNAEIGLLYASSEIDSNLFSYNFNILTEKDGIKIESLNLSNAQDEISFPLHISVDDGFITNLKIKVDSSYNLDNLTVKITDENGNELDGSLRLVNGYIYFTNNNSSQTCLNIYVYASYVSEDGQVYDNVPLAVDKTDADGDGKADNYAISVGVQK